MKRLSLLKILSTILLVISGIAMFFAVPFVLVVAFLPGSVPFDINGTKAVDASVESILVLAFTVIGYAFDVYALYLFKKVLELFEKKKIFHDDVIKHFDQIGKAIIIGYVVMAVPAVLYKMLVEGSVALSVDFDFDETLLTLGLGLFFMVLSEVFLIAKGLKEENDLTV